MKNGLHKYSPTPLCFCRIPTKKESEAKRANSLLKVIQVGIWLSQSLHWVVSLHSSYFLQRANHKICPLQIVLIHNQLKHTSILFANKVAYRFLVALAYFPMMSLVRQEAFPISVSDSVKQWERDPPLLTRSGPIFAVAQEPQVIISCWLI